MILALIKKIVERLVSRASKLKDAAKGLDRTMGGMIEEALDVHFFEKLGEEFFEDIDKRRKESEYRLNNKKKKRGRPKGVKNGQGK